MLPVVHYAHLLLGMLWLGGTLLMVLAIYPALARLPAAEAQRIMAAVDRVGASLLMVSGTLTLILGPWRAYISGNFTTWGDLAHPYAHTVITAFVLVLVAQGLDHRFRSKFKRLMADPAAFAAQGPAMASRAMMTQTGLMLVVLALMALLGLALY
jgi:hypothetical protein